MDPVRTHKRQQQEKYSPTQPVLNIISSRSGTSREIMTMLNVATSKNSPTKSNRTTQHNTPNKDKTLHNNNHRLNIPARNDKPEGL